MSQLSQQGRVDAQLKKTGGPKSPPRQPSGAPAAGRGYGGNAGAGAGGRGAQGPSRGGRRFPGPGAGGRGPPSEGRFQDQPSGQPVAPAAPPPTDSHIDWPTVGGGKAGAAPKPAPQAAKPAAAPPGGPSTQANAPPASGAAPAANGSGAPAKPAVGGQPLSYAKAARPQGVAAPAEKNPPAAGGAAGAQKKEAGAEKGVKEPAGAAPPANGNAGKDGGGSAPMMQFGSLPAQLPQFPARTSSAPPSLEEQNRNRQHLEHLAGHQPQIPSKARFEPNAGKRPAGGQQPPQVFYPPQQAPAPPSRSKLDSPLSPVLEPTGPPPATPPHMQLADLPPSAAIAPTGWGGGSTAPVTFPSAASIQGATFGPGADPPRTQTATNGAQGPPVVQYQPRAQGGVSQAGSQPPQGRQPQGYQYGGQGAPGYGQSVMGQGHMSTPMGQMPIQYGAQQQTPSSQTTPSVTIQPRVSKAIRIINPNTKEEVKPPSVEGKDKKEGKPPVAPQQPSGGVQTPGQAGPQTRSSPPMQPQQPPQQQRPPPPMVFQQTHGQPQMYYPMQGYPQQQPPYFGQRPAGPQQGVPNQGQGAPPFQFQQQPQHPGGMARPYMQHAGGMVPQPNKPPGSGLENQGGPQMMGQMAMQQPGGQMLRPPGPPMQQPGPNGRPALRPGQDEQHFMQGSPPNNMFFSGQVSNFGGGEQAPQPTGPMVPGMSTVGFNGANIRPPIGGPSGWGPRPPQMMNQQGRGMAPQGGARITTVQAPGPMDKQQRQPEGRPGSAGQGSNKERKKRDKDQQRPLPQGGISASALTAAQQAQQPRPPQVNAPISGGQAPTQIRGGEAASSGGEKGVISVSHPGAGVSPPGTHPVVSAPPHGVGASVGQAVVSAPSQEAKQAGGAGGAGVEGAFKHGRPAQLGSQAQVRELTHQKSGKFRDALPPGSVASPRGRGGDSPRSQKSDKQPTQVFRPKVDQPNVAAAKAAAAAKESAQSQAEPEVAKSEAVTVAPEAGTVAEKGDVKAKEGLGEAKAKELEEGGVTKETFAQKAAKAKPAAAGAAKPSASEGKVTPSIGAKPAEGKVKVGEKDKEERAKADADAKAKVEAEAKAKAEAEAKMKERERAEAEAKRKAEDELKAKAEAEAKRKEEEERRAKEEAEKKAKEEAAKKAEAERKAKLEAERKEAERKKLEAERKAKAEEEARKKKEEERIRAEAEAKEREEKKRKEEEKRREEERKKAEAKAKAEAEAKAKAEAEAKAKAEAEAKANAEAEAKAKAEAEAKAKAEAEAKAKAEAEAKSKAEAKAKAEAEAKAKAEAEAKAKKEKEEAEGRRKAEEEKKRAEAKGKAEAESKAAKETAAPKKVSDGVKVVGPASAAVTLGAVAAGVVAAKTGPSQEEKPGIPAEKAGTEKAVAVEAPSEEAVPEKAAAESAPSEKEASDKASERPTSPVKEVESAASKKKKRKEALSKADAAGDSKNLLDAFTTKKPDEAPRPAAAFETPKKEKQPAASKVEVDDWEEAADIPTPKPARGGSISQRPSTPADKRYTRDYLMTFKEEHGGWPDVVMDKTNAVLFVQPDMPKPRTPSGKRGGKAAPPEDDKWLQRGPSGIAGDPRLDSPSRGGPPPGNFRPGGPGPSLGGRGMRPGGPPGAGGRGPGGQFVPPGVNPALLGLPAGGPGQNGIDANRWGKKPMEPVAPKQPLPAIHKTQNRFVVGKPTDEETAKIKRVKGILNKLTPENFERLFQQMIDVEISNATTLTMVIAQVFEKALLEPSFCELYAEFSKRLQTELPEFMEKDEEGNEVKVTFRRILLNKCQEEFERSNEQVDENSEERPEEGAEEDAKPDKEVKKLTPKQVEEENKKIRQRFLGNVRFIGELYKKGLLTEKIMHVCITKLLGGEAVPHEEDLEALCKLMTTIGAMIDHQKSKAHMDAYLKRMSQLSRDASLSSRIRFGLLDVVEMRDSGWRERRKKDGPKTIDQVHRDAAQENRDKLAAASARPDMRRGGGGSGRRDFPPQQMRGGPGPIFPNPPPMRGGPMGRGPGDARLADRMDGPIRGISARHDDGQLILGPGGRGGRGFGPPGQMRGEPLIQDDRFGGNRPLRDRDGRPIDPRGGGDRFGDRGGPGPDRFGDRGLAGPDRFGGGYDRGMDRRGEFERGPPREFDRRDRDEGPSRDRSPLLNPPSRPTSASSERDSGSRLGAPSREASTSRPATPQSPDVGKPSEEAPAEEELERRTLGALKEFYGLQDVKEVEAILESLDAASYHPKMIALWVQNAIEGKDVARTSLAKLIPVLAQGDKKLITREQIEEGFKIFLEALGDIVIDVPLAYSHTAALLSTLISARLISLPVVGKLLKHGGYEEGELVSEGGALKVLVGLLKRMKDESGEEAMVESFNGSGLELKDFVGSEKDRAEQQLRDNGLGVLLG